MKLTRLDGQAFHRSAPCHFERSREIQARGWQSRHIWLPCARTSPVPLPSFRRRPESRGARGRANEGINR